MTIPTTVAALMRLTTVSRHDAFDAQALLKDLRGENGDNMRSLVVGYVMAVRDAARGRGAEAATLADDLQRIERWLLAHPESQQMPAAAAIRAAVGLDEPEGGAAPSASGPTAGGMRVGGRTLRRMGSRMIAGAALAGIAGGLSLGLVLRSSGQDATIGLQVQEMQQLVLEERRYEKDSFINIDNRSQAVAYAQKWREARGALQDAVARMEELQLTDQERTGLSEIEADLRTYADGYERVLSMMRSGSIRTTADANAELARYKSAVHRAEERMSTLGARLSGRRAR